MAPSGLILRVISARDLAVNQMPGGTMSKRRLFSRVMFALTSAILSASCFSTPTGPPSAPQALTTAAPTIALSRTTLGLCYPDYATSTRHCGSGGSVTISNSGGGTLNWTSTKSRPWLRRSPFAGTAPSTMKVRVDGTGVAPGMYYGAIYIWATGATNSPQRITVQFIRKP
jgi:hypothetical protein